MLFRYTENPPENRFVGPGFLRLGGLRMGYTENSSFPYIGRFGRWAPGEVRYLTPEGPPTPSDVHTLRRLHPKSVTCPRGEAGKRP